MHGAIAIDQAYARAAGVQTSPLFIVQTARERSEERAMEGESTTLRSEVQVLLDDPANFYNIVMSRSGEAGGPEEDAADFLAWDDIL